MLGEYAICVEKQQARERLDNTVLAVNGSRLSEFPLEMDDSTWLKAIRRQVRV